MADNLGGRYSVSNTHYWQMKGTEHLSLLLIKSQTCAGFYDSKGNKRKREKEAFSRVCMCVCEIESEKSVCLHSTDTSHYFCAIYGFITQTRVPRLQTSLCWVNMISWSLCSRRSSLTSHSASHFISSLRLTAICRLQRQPTLWDFASLNNFSCSKMKYLPLSSGSSQPLCHKHLLCVPNYEDVVSKTYVSN